jgi:hypothetical protein
MKPSKYDPQDPYGCHHGCLALSQRLEWVLGQEGQDSHFPYPHCGEPCFDRAPGFPRIVFQRGEICGGWRWARHLRAKPKVSMPNPGGIYRCIKAQSPSFV